MTANNLPVLANPTLASLDTSALIGWQGHFVLLTCAGEFFEDVYAPSRATDFICDELAWRDGFEAPWGHDEDIRLFDTWES